MILLKPVFIIALVAVAMIGVMVPNVFADVVITSTIGSATPGCEESSSCFFPSVATVNVGETIIFLNIDDVAHIFTSGIPSDDVIGTEFNSGTVSPGDAFTWIPQNVGEFSYFDITHPWMQGLIVVEPTVTTVPITISINKSTYEDGDFLLVSGTATPNEELEIILFANAENVVAREFITVDSSGSYSTSLETFDSTYMVFGEYGVLAASQTDDRYNVVYFEFIDTTPVVTIVSTNITLDSIPSSEFACIQTGLPEIGVPSVVVSFPVTMNGP